MTRLALPGIILLLAFGSADAGAKKHVPRAVVLVVDRSGSMQGGKLEGAKAAAVASLGVLAPDDQFALVTFDSEAVVFVPLQPVANAKQITKTIARLQCGG